ncbi:Regucalcin gene promoter region-related protein (RGPR) [Phaffia rhodozyma]|uniref:Protein transport protein sec16 n=1 Tax=Phaffia rhodozyma TaxID=264483 RepID=A0A0F7SEA6_PHARH|nr:Regucalcin gene promoter region-related protein (RGPR) [Phaffia rhodozyma]
MDDSQSGPPPDPVKHTDDPSDLQIEIKNSAASHSPEEPEPSSHEATNEVVPQDLFTQDPLDFGEEPDGWEEELSREISIEPLGLVETGTDDQVAASAEIPFDEDSAGTSFDLEQESSNNTVPVVAEVEVEVVEEVQPIELSREVEEQTSQAENIVQPTVSDSIPFDDETFDSGFNLGEELGNEASLEPTAGLNDGSSFARDLVGALPDLNDAPANNAWEETTVDQSPANFFDEEVSDYPTFDLPSSPSPPPPPSPPPAMEPAVPPTIKRTVTANPYASRLPYNSGPQAVNSAPSLPSQVSLSSPPQAPFSPSLSPFAAAPPPRLVKSPNPYMSPNPYSSPSLGNNPYAAFASPSQPSSGYFSSSPPPSSSPAFAASASLMSVAAPPPVDAAPPPPPPPPPARSTSAVYAPPPAVRSAPPPAPPPFARPPPPPPAASSYSPYRYASPVQTSVSTPKSPAHGQIAPVATSPSTPSSPQTTQPSLVASPPSPPSVPSSYTPSSSFVPHPTSIPTHSFAPPPPSSASTFVPQPQPSAPTQPSAYAPQVLHDATEDHLGRGRETFKKVPVFSFGFGGRFVVCYPSLGVGGGYGAFGTGLHGEGDQGDGRTIQIKTMADVSPESDISSPSFPGPLFLDPATIKNAAGEKAKKASVLAYIDNQASEIEQGLAWVKGKGDEIKFRDQEGKAILLRLLAVMIENEGRLMGSDAAKDSVRAILMPGHTSSAAGTNLTRANTPSLGSFRSGSPVVALTSTSSYAPRTSMDSDSGGFTQPLSSKSSALDQLSTLLVQGERKSAVEFAIKEKLWSHALIISSSVDKQAFAEVVKAFTRSELSGHGGSTGKSRDALKLTYDMFGGVNHGLPSATVSTGAFDQTAVSSDWREVAAMISANRSLGDTEALISLGNSLVTKGWVNAGHVCYLLSNTPPPLNPLGGPLAPRVHLYTMSTHPGRHIDLDAVIITELIEYALSLIPVLKGQEPFRGIDYLQPYKLLHALTLVESGDVARAQKYCDAIAASLKLYKAPSASHTLPFLSQLQELSQMLSGTSSNDSTGSWISRTVTKPSLDGFGSWFEGRLTKFVAGEDGTASPSNSELAMASSSVKPIGSGGSAPQNNGSLAPIGPFSHYNSISPGPSFAALSRPPSTDNIYYQPSSSYAPSTASIYQPAGESYTPYEAESVSVEESKEGLSAYRQSREVEGKDDVHQDDDDDLGLGNASRKKKTNKAAVESEESKDDGKDEKREEEKKTDEAKPAAGGSWLGRLWGGKKTDSTQSPTKSAPIKAKLGEESAFYYDNDLKKWINKKAGPEAEAPKPPPPPPRAQTMSPASSSQRAPPPSSLRQSFSPPPMSSSAPAPPSGPPPRSASATPGAQPSPLAGPPAGPPSRAGSVPPPKPGVVDPTADLLSRMGTPTAGGTAAKKKNLRSRYVEVT